MNNASSLIREAEAGDRDRSLDDGFMRQALELASAAAEQHEVPVGALIVREGKVIGRGFNAPIGACDPSAHAEIRALRDAAYREKNYRLPDSTLYVTIEPCTMCLGAIIHARITCIVYGAHEPKAGMLSSNDAIVNARCFNHQLLWQGGVLETECAEKISHFFQQRRALKAQLKALKDL